MKAGRQSAILEIVRNHRVHNQEQLGDLLAARGIQVTQATLSRDVRELGLAKVADPAGGAFYSLPPGREVHPSLDYLLPSLMLSVDGVGPLVVVRTPAGSAEALGGALDAASWDGVLGTIAGDDTLLIIAKSERHRRDLIKRLVNMGRRASP